MKKISLVLFVFSLLVSMSSVHANSVYMVLEQDSRGKATNYAADLSPLGDGFDPVLQFILFENPAEPDTAQVLWQASETPIQWQRAIGQSTYRFVEYAALPDDSRLEYRVFRYQDGVELMDLRHSRDGDDQNLGVDASIIDGLPNDE